MSNRSRRVLLVASSSPPYLSASVHRIRQLSWSLREAGWEAEILAPSEEFQNPEWKDPRGAELFPRYVPVHLAHPSQPDWLRMAGVRGMGWRGWTPMARKGSVLLQSGRFNLVYISTTQFNFFCLGSWWKKKHQTPYILDFHDPWYRPGQVIRTTRSRAKASLGNKIAWLLERIAVSSAEGLVSVSPIYLEHLRARYPTAACFGNNQTAAIPFGFCEEDFSREISPKPGKKIKQIVYVGVGSELMIKSFRRILEGVLAVTATMPEMLKAIRISLYGTDGRWKPGQPKILQTLAEQLGLGELVKEDPTILPYSKSLELMRNADGLLVLGVEDPAYMPSKLFSYSRSEKPLLASLVSRSQALEYFQKIPAMGHVVTFSDPNENTKSEDVIKTFLKEVVEVKEFKRKEMCEKYSDLTMAKKHAVFFEKILADPKK